MYPLVYLSVRSVVNGVRRALSSGKRLVSLLFVIAYYLWLFVRPALFMGSSGKMPAFHTRTLVEMPAQSYIEAVVFTVLSLLSLMLMMGSGQKTTFRQADLDVLFPTPINPWYVMLFRLGLEYFGTLLLPLFFALVGFRGFKVGLSAFIANFPEEAGIALRLLTISWLLLTAFWVCVNYCLGLWLNRSGPRSELVRNVYTYSVTFLILGIAAYGYYVGREVDSFERYVNLTHLWPFRTFFFSANLTSAFVMGPLSKAPLMTIVYAMLLIAGAGAALYGCYLKRGYLYDQVASKSNQRGQLREMARKGDSMAVYAEYARRGRLKARYSWFAKVKALGIGSLIWKDVLIQLRSLQAVAVMALLIPVLILGMERSLGSTRALGPLYLMMCGLALLMLAASGSVMMAVEMLKRVDFHKPLPFTSGQMAMADIAASAFLPSITVLLPTLAGFVIFPGTWQWFLAALIAMPALALVLTGVTYTVNVIFPDYEDPTQKGFRGLMMLLGLAIVISPGLLAMVGLTVVTKTPLLGSVVWALINLGAAFVLGLISGYFYDGYNPSE